MSDKDNSDRAAAVGAAWMSLLAGIGFGLIAQHWYGSSVGLGVCLVSIVGMFILFAKLHGETE